GLRLVLPDRDVSQEKVERAFDQIARRVEDRPQDTVVVFLAGHTGVFDPQRFCLLLPSYPFPAEEPILVAARGAAPVAGEAARIDPKHVPPVPIGAVNLVPLKALKPLGIGGAWQAGAVLGGPPGPRDPEVGGDRLATGPNLLPHGRAPGRARPGG